MVIQKKFVALLTTAVLGFSGAAFAGCNIDNDVITKDIKKKMEKDAIVSTSNITVVTKDCVVTLTGMVNTGDEASTAVEIASSTPGVTDVETENLTVKDSSQPFTDAYITSKVKGAFVREKVFGDKPIAVSIHVETKDGVVFLTGTAKPEQAATAEKLAKEVKGVKEVKSKIDAKNAG